jgi:hypothetical protein
VPYATHDISPSWLLTHCVTLDRLRCLGLRAGQNVCGSLARSVCGQVGSTRIDSF